MTVQSAGGPPPSLCGRRLRGGPGGRRGFLAVPPRDRGEGCGLAQGSCARDVTARSHSEACPPRSDRAGGTPVCWGASTAAPVRRGRGVGPVSSLHRGLPWGRGPQRTHPMRAHPRCSPEGALAGDAAEWLVCQTIAHQGLRGAIVPRVREACVQG